MADILQKIIHHVFLPPRIPAGEDDGSWAPTLLEYVLSSLHKFQHLQSDEAVTVVAKAIVGIESFQETLTASGGTSGPKLLALLNSIDHNGKASKNDQINNTDRKSIKVDLFLCTSQPKTPASVFVQRHPT